ncbi:MAG: hypothetical protein ABL974_05465 [Prosthecobacter sp.]
MVSEIAASDWGAEFLGGFDGERECLFRRAVCGFPSVGSGADAAGADVEFESGFVGLVFEALQIGVFKGFKDAQLGDEAGVELQ